MIPLSTTRILTSQLKKKLYTSMYMAIAVLSEPLGSLRVVIASNIWFSNLNKNKVKNKSISKYLKSIPHELSKAL